MARLKVSQILVLASLPILAFLVLPSLVIVPMALTAGRLIQFPPVGLSLHSFSDYLSDPDWVGVDPAIVQGGDLRGHHRRDRR